MPKIALSHAPILDTLQFLKKQLAPKSPEYAFVESDFFYVKDFLFQYASSQSTFDAYRRELERLLQWAWHVKESSILTLKRADIEQYINFCYQPPKNWIGLKTVPRFVTRQGQRLPNPDWRLFVVKTTKAETKSGRDKKIAQFNFSNQAISCLFIALGSFYQYLLNETIIEANPVAQIRQKSKYQRKQQNSRPVRRLTELQWSFVIETAEIMASENPELHERTLFIMSIFYLLYLRVSELRANDRWQPQMGDFYQDGHGNWWFKTVGKGNKERDVSVPPDMLKALKRYRAHRQLSPALPLPNETTPLIHSLKSPTGLKDTRQIRLIVQKCFDKATQRMQHEGFEDEVEQLKAATVHWLRHTGISDDINKRGRPIAHVRDDAGHSSSNITDRYNDVTLAERHRSAQHKELKE